MTEKKKKVVIHIEVPEWAIGRHVRVFAGVEQIAYKKVVSGFPNVKYGKTMIKVGRCSMCGECCRRTGCPYLKHEVWNGKDVWVCDHTKLPKGRPFVCCVGSGETEEDYCTVRYKEA